MKTFSNFWKFSKKFQNYLIFFKKKFVENYLKNIFSLIILEGTMLYLLIDFNQLNDENYKLIWSK